VFATRSLPHVNARIAHPKGVQQISVQKRRLKSSTLQGPQSGHIVVSSTLGQSALPESRQPVSAAHGRSLLRAFKCTRIFLAERPIQRPTTNPRRASAPVRTINTYKLPGAKGTCFTVRLPRSFNLPPSPRGSRHCAAHPRSQYYRQGIQSLVQSTAYRHSHHGHHRC
jgi:hypothetical protein